MTAEREAPLVQKRKLGLSDIEVSVVGLGCNNFGGRTDLAGTRAVVHRALDLGVTLFDTADVYGNRGKSEEYLGEALGARRKDIVLATKFGMAMSNSARSRNASPDYIMRAVEASLRRLRTDWIDLYQVHRPDPATPIEETMGALDALVREGKVRVIGCSNYSPAELDAAQAAANQGKRAYFVTCQDELSLMARGIEKDLLPAMERRGLSLLPYFPLASGLLTGKYRRNAPSPAGARLSYSRDHAADFISARNWTLIERLAEIAERASCSLLELAFGWLLAKPVVASVIAGATKPEQIEQNVAAAARAPSAAAIAEADAVTR
jgi:aryl-alcohol dehydrogenase-like predicted oxidoreductase